MMAAAWLLLKRFSTPLLLVTFMALVAVGSWATLQRVKANSLINGLEKSLGEVKGERDKAKLDLSEGKRLGAVTLAEKQEENRKLALGWQKAFDDAELERSNERKKLQATVVAVTGDRDRLRKLTSTATRPDPIYASGSSCDTPAFRRVVETSQTLGELLGTSDGISQDLGVEAEDLAGQVRGLQFAFAALRAKVISGELVTMK